MRGDEGGEQNRSKRWWIRSSGGGPSGGYDPHLVRTTQRDRVGGGAGGWSKREVGDWVVRPRMVSARERERGKEER